jgi:predicted nucleic acid-binding Zn ribbon protein
MMTTRTGKKRVGRNAPDDTREQPRRKTVFKLADGTLVTSGRVTVQRHRYTPRARGCKVCGAVFKPASKAAKYCSDACRAKAFRERKAAASVGAPKEVIVEQLTCAHCQQGFFAVKGKGALYCSATCRATAYKRRRAAAVAALADDLGMTQDEAQDALELRGLKEIIRHLTSRGYLYDHIARMWVVPMLAMQTPVWREEQRIE